jgi:hypothetical protein
MASGRVGRRGLVAGAMALITAGLAKIAGPGTAEATHGGGADVTALHVGQSNAATTATSLTRVSGSGAGGALNVVNENSSTAVLGLTVGGTGIQGTASGVSADPHYGVVGLVGSNPPISFFDRPVGVYGASPLYTGVMGDSGDAPGVVGRSTGSGGNPGVLGQGAGPNGAGVIGLQPGVATPGGMSGPGCTGAG